MELPIAPPVKKKPAIQERKGGSMQPSDPRPDAGRSEEHEDRHVTRTLLWIGAAGLTASLAFTLVRVLVRMRRPPDDPTSLRIQQLIDEANSLIKTLDEQRNSA